MENGERKENGSEFFDKERFKEILAFIEKTDLEFVELEKDGKKFAFRRSPTAVAPSRRAEAPAAAPAPQEPPKPQFISIRSPIVGRFYSSVAPDRPPLVVEGGLITAGQKVAIVEAMKIKKEVFSPATGKVVRIHVREGDAVEYGQELFSVEPQREDEE